MPTINKPTFKRIDISLPELPPHLELAIPHEAKDEPNKENVWVFSFPHEVNKELASLYQTNDIEFFVRLGVATGNIYKALFLGSYPAYTAGYIEDEEGEITAARFSTYVPIKTFDFKSGTENFDDIEKVEDDTASERLKICDYEIKQGTDELKVSEDHSKPIELMRLLALCAFFGDHDVVKENIGLIEDDLMINSIKLDPEAAFNQAFFTESEETIQNYCQNIFTTDLFEQYVLFLFNDDLYSPKYSCDDPVISALLQSKKTEQLFIQSLKFIANQPIEFFLNILKKDFGEAYEPQFAIIKDALEKRLTLFRKHLALTHTNELPLPETINSSNKNQNRAFGLWSPSKTTTTTAQEHLQKDQTNKIKWEDRTSSAEDKPAKHLKSSHKLN